MSLCYKIYLVIITCPFIIQASTDPSPAARSRSFRVLDRVETFCQTQGDHCARISCIIMAPQSLSCAMGSYALRKAEEAAHSSPFDPADPRITHELDTAASLLLTGLGFALTGTACYAIKCALSYYKLKYYTHDESISLNSNQEEIPHQAEMRNETMVLQGNDCLRDTGRVLYFLGNLGAGGSAFISAMFCGIIPAATASNDFSKQENISESYHSLFRSSIACSLSGMLSYGGYKLRKYYTRTQYAPLLEGTP